LYHKRSIAKTSPALVCTDVLKKAYKKSTTPKCKSKYYFDKNKKRLWILLQSLLFYDIDVLLVVQFSLDELTVKTSDVRD
jgi:hypothetical protein